MSKRILVIDNYDSFTYNLVQALQVLGAEVVVHRNDQISIQQCLDLAPSHLVVSPGPGRPDDAGVSLDVIEALLGKAAILGVCLGHQCLAQVLGGTVVPAQKLMHGKSSPVYHDGKTLYGDLPNPFEAGRYHSLAVQADDLPCTLEVVAHTRDGEIMGVRHKTLVAEGVQFHPESILTPEGDKLLGNFVAMEGSGVLRMAAGEET